MQKAKPGAKASRYFILVFQTETNLPVLKLLKKGYRHCFVYQIDRDRDIIKINSLSNITMINIIKHITPVDLIRKHRRMGHKCLVLPAADSIRPNMAPLLPFTCVESIKRLIGLHRFSIITPWQLYKYAKEQIGKIYLDK